MCDCPPCPLSPHSVRAVLADLQKARVITGFESRDLKDPSAVVKLQSKKSPEMMVTTADILRAHGFANESQILTGEWIDLICVCRTCNGALFKLKS